MKQYQYIRQGSTTIIYINSNNCTLKLLYELSSLTGTYSGMTVDNSYLDTIAHFSAYYPKIWQCIEPIEVLKRLKEYRFELTEPKKWQLTLLA